MVVLLALVALWTGCSLEKNYQLLSFFFDGVPDPRLVATGSNAVRIAKETGGVYYIHEPYAQQQCNQCHGGAFTGEMRADVDPRACLKCHAANHEERYQ